MQIVNQVKPILGAVAAVAAACVVLLKAFGVRGVVMGSTFDWACASVSCALASQGGGAAQ